MTNEEYHDLKEDYIQHILDYVKDNGSLFPHLSVFADIKKPKEEEIGKPALIHIPIDDEYMKDDESKDRFVDEILPNLFKELKTRFTPHGVAWAAEAWMRVAEKDFDPSKDNWKAIPIKKEIIMISVESENANDCFIYEIKRIGKQVNSDGDFVDIVELERLDGDFATATKLAGRFTGLFKKIKD
jgi:hypothetical protein